MVSTSLIVVLIPLVLGLIDIFLYWMGGNEATISVTMLAIRVKYAIVAWITAYTFGVFYGHCFLPAPEVVPPPTHWVLACFIMGMSPTFAALVLIFSNDGGRLEHNHIVLDPLNQLKFASLSVGCFVVGMIVGRFVLRQHPLAAG